MRRTPVTLAAAGLLAMSMLLPNAGPAAAITGNFVEDHEHPFVGLAVFYDVSGEPSHLCSGSLLAPRVFLTAGHCIEGAQTARVYFQQDAGARYDPDTQAPDPVTGYPEACAAGTLGVLCATSDALHNYGYSGSARDRKDAGLIILDQPISLAEYGALAAAGSLDRLATRRGRQGVTFTLSGYGLTYTNPQVEVWFRERLMARSQLVNLRSALTGGVNLQTSNNPGIGGGACFGDSGGPVFYGGFGSNLIAGITSFGQTTKVCAGVDFAYRTDTTAVLDWILATVPAGEAGQIRILPLS